MLETRRAYLRLSLLAGIGPYLTRHLIQACGSVCAIQCAPTQTLRQVEGVGKKLLSILQENIDAEIDTVISQCEANDIQWVCPEDEQYPHSLVELDDSPLILYVMGDVGLLSHSRILAVVGARRCSQQSKVLTRRWSRYLAERSVCICSGMASGVDGAAHGGVLDAKQATIAVLGCGLATLSHTQSRQVDAIMQLGGCILSEYVPTAGARPEFFPRRNRIIAGLSVATLVTEADIRSGSLITARQAIGYGRDVFAVPGSVFDAKHKGCHQLLRDGASLVEGAEDILSYLQWDSHSDKAQTYQPTSALEAEILQLIAHDICHVDTLLQHCRLTLPELSPTLLALELLGVIHVLPGNRYTLS